MKASRLIQSCAVFVGNDINNLTDGQSWKDLVIDLAEYVGGAQQFDLDTEPFPLIYEQLYLIGMRNGKLKKESELKKRIANWACNIRHSNIHQRILNLGVEHIITPNYDFSIERASGVIGKVPNRVSSYGESVYSLFRHYECNGQKIWHIHGDVAHPRSINLGYEQYSGSLHRMRDYVMTGKARPEIKEALMERLNRGDHTLNSWLDLFFTRNIHIFGFRFDLVEMHLWWLIAYRAKRIATSRKTSTIDRGQYYPRNQIAYYYPKSLLLKDETKEMTQRRLKYLDGFEVKTICLDDEKGNEAYYKNVPGTNI